jgi:hypothetical protein
VKFAKGWRFWDEREQAIYDEALRLDAAPLLVVRNNDEGSFAESGWILTYSCRPEWSTEVSVEVLDSGKTRAICKGYDFERSRMIDRLLRAFVRSDGSTDVCQQVLDESRTVAWEGLMTQLQLRPEDIEDCVAGFDHDTLARTCNSHINPYWKNLDADDWNLQIRDRLKRWKQLKSGDVEQVAPTGPTSYLLFENPSLAGSILANRLDYREILSDRRNRMNLLYAVRTVPEPGAPR